MNASPGNSSPDQGRPDPASSALANINRDMQLQEEAERAEREQLAPGGDPRVDRYRMIVRALRQPLESQLPEDFAMRVAAKAMRRGGNTLEDALVGGLLLAMGAFALLFIGPVLAKSAHEIVSVAAPSLPWHLLATAAACIGVVWAIDRGWMSLHPGPRRR